MLSCGVSVRPVGHRDEEKIFLMDFFFSNFLQKE